MSEIQPAMTADEWAEVLGPKLTASHQLNWQIAFDAHLSRTTRYEHARAALSLYGQTFGFSWEDVRMLRYLVSVLDGLPESAGKIQFLADRIAALLPQETP